MHRLLRVLLSRPAEVLVRGFGGVLFRRELIPADAVLAVAAIWAVFEIGVLADAVIRAVITHDGYAHFRAEQDSSRWVEQPSH